MCFPVYVLVCLYVCVFLHVCVCVCVCAPAVPAVNDSFVGLSPADVPVTPNLRTWRPPCLFLQMYSYSLALSVIHNRASFSRERAPRLRLETAPLSSRKLITQAITGKRWPLPHHNGFSLSDSLFYSPCPKWNRFTKNRYS